MSTAAVSLFRENEIQPWGFRLGGGRDQGQPLFVQLITQGSIAESRGLRKGDKILQIGYVRTVDMTYDDAMEAILEAENRLDLLLFRSNVKNGEHTEQITSPQIQAIVHSQYNSPMGLYSTENITNALITQAQVLTNGAVGVDFKTMSSPVLKKSATYQLVQEEDRKEGSLSPSPKSPTSVARKTPPPPPPKPSGRVDQHQYQQQQYQQQHYQQQQSQPQQYYQQQQQYHQQQQQLQRQQQQQYQNQQQQWYHQQQHEEEQRRLERARQEQLYRKQEEEQRRLEQAREEQLHRKRQEEEQKRLERVRKEQLFRQEQEEEQRRLERARQEQLFRQQQQEEQRRLEKARQQQYQQQTQQTPRVPSPQHRAVSTHTQQISSPPRARRVGTRTMSGDEDYTPVATSYEAHVNHVNATQGHTPGHGTWQRPAGPPKKSVWPPPPQNQPIITSSQSVKWGGSDKRSKRFIWPPPKGVYYDENGEEYPGHGHHGQPIHTGFDQHNQYQAHVNAVNAQERNRARLNRPATRLAAQAWEPYTYKSEHASYHRIKPTVRFRNPREVMQHCSNSTPLPPTYRTPPGTQHVEIEYELDYE